MVIYGIFWSEAAGAVAVGGRKSRGGSWASPASPRDVPGTSRPAGGGPVSANVALEVANPI